MDHCITLDNTREDGFDLQRRHVLSFSITRNNGVALSLHALQYISPRPLVVELHLIDVTMHQFFKRSLRTMDLHNVLLGQALLLKLLLGLFSFNKPGTIFFR
ncbi:hypothetical protein D3C71_1642460 [compost metagenome]